MKAIKKYFLDHQNVLISYIKKKTNKHFMVKMLHFVTTFKA